MSTQVSESFIKQFEAEVHLCYQQNGSKLRNTVRYKTALKALRPSFRRSARALLRRRRATDWCRL